MKRTLSLVVIGLVVSGGALAGAAEDVAPTDVAHFNAQVAPFLATFCADCHGPQDAEADFRIDNIDPRVTSGGDVERWEKVLEMIDIADMPPEEADAQPTRRQRNEIAAWLTVELKKIGRGPDEARLARPEFGNRVDHESLFSGEHPGPAYSPARMWRRNAHIQRALENRRRLPAGSRPFSPKGGRGFQDYAMLLANESTITAVRLDARNYAAEILDGRLAHPTGPDSKQDKTRLVREGKSRYSEFEALRDAQGQASEEDLRRAVTRAFALLMDREPTAAELQRYAVEFLGPAIEIAGGRQALEGLLAAILLSPEFVYRQEIGLGESLSDGRRMLSPEEIAYALAYALTDSPPDELLRKAVDEGRLATREDVAREARRMLSADTRDYWSYEINHTFQRHIEACPNPRVLRFFREFFGYDQALNVFKDKSRNPHHRAPFLFKDADLFVLSILEEDQQVLRKLLTSDRYVVHYVSAEQAERKLKQFRESKDERVREKLARGETPVLGGYRGGHYYTTYGFEWETWDYPVEQPFSVPHRAGMLTHPAWLVAHSGNFDTDVIRRGKWIREHLLADTIPEIPIGVDAALEDDPHKTMREKLAKTAQSECWRCHKKMNPLGLPFEAFDDFGRYRENFYFDQTGKLAGTYYERQQQVKYAQQRKQPPVEFTARPIDTTGELRGTVDKQLDGEVSDPFDLVNRLADSDRVRQSFVRHAFRYWMGRNETLDDSPTLIAADKAYLDSDGSFRELLIALLTSDSFLLRRIHHKMLNRREVLKGASVGTGGLLLAPLARQLRAAATGDETRLPKRLVFVVRANGLRPWGIAPVGLEKFGQPRHQQEKFFQASLAERKLHPTLASLEPLRDYVTIVNGLSSKAGRRERSARSELRHAGRLPLRQRRTAGSSNHRRRAGPGDARDLSPPGIQDGARRRSDRAPQRLGKRSGQAAAVFLFTATRLPATVWRAGDGERDAGGGQAGQASARLRRAGRAASSNAACAVGAAQTRQLSRRL